MILTNSPNELTNSILKIRKKKLYAPHDNKKKKELKFGSNLHNFHC